MQDIPDRDGGGGAALAGAATTPLRFSGLILDLEACTLVRDSGEPIPLTRGEFALLRFFVSRPGRALSRDLLLDAFASRRMEPFDRSVDVLVSRLRHKIEPDPKQPKLIVTVPGEGYRFDGRAQDGPEAADPRPGQPSPPEPPPLRRDARAPAGLLSPLARRPGWIAPILTSLVLALTTALSVVRMDGRPDPREPAVAVLPFADLGGGKDNYFGEGVADELRTILSTFPGIRVLSEATPAASRPDSAVPDFILRGGLLKGPEKVRVTAQLVDRKTGQNVWADRFDEDDANVPAMQEAIANRIYDSIAGLEGSIRSEEERNAWRKTAPSLTEYDYVLRGSSYILRPTCDDDLRAREIFEEGLRKYPDSALLRIKLAFTYSNAVEFFCSSDPRGDIERSWSIAQEALAKNEKSRLATWLAHWLMTVLYQWREQDFDRSVAEAEAAVKLVPYDARSRGSLSFYLANAGKFERAAEWAEFGMKANAKFACLNLAWAYYLMNRNEAAIELLERKCDPTLPGHMQQLAAAYVRLGRLDEARTVMAKWMATNPRDSIAFETSWPIRPELKASYVADLRQAGMPD